MGRGGLTEGEKTERPESENAYIIILPSATTISEVFDTP